MLQHGLIVACTSEAVLKAIANTNVSMKMTDPMVSTLFNSITSLQSPQNELYQHTRHMWSQ
jgi:hypothetical protein